jgi:hypothetical protein
MDAISVETQWAHELFGIAELGDIRRTNRLIRVAADLSHFAGSSFCQANGHDAAALEGAYRFIRNEAVDPQAIREAGFVAAALRAERANTLLAVDDSTTLGFHHRVAAQLGDLGGPQQSTSRGFQVHSTLLLDAQTEQTLGLIEQHDWIRADTSRGQKHQRRERDYISKESYKWQRASERMRLRLGPETMRRVISVCDREADVYEYLSDKRAHHERFVVRACWNRRVKIDEPEEQNAAHLYTALSHARQVAQLQIQVPQRGGRPARTAELTVQTLRVRLYRPQHGMNRGGPEHLGVNVVVALELEPPAGQPPLEWILLTTEPTHTAEEALKVLRYYGLRWRVEEFHKAWKSGAGVERQRHQRASHLHRAAVLLAFVAVRLLQLREAVANTPEQSCEVVLERLQWQVLWASVEKTRPPKEAPSLQWAYRALGKLARWTDTKRTGRIGWQTLWRGWHELQLRIEGYQASRLLSDAEM